ncbi:MOLYBDOPTERIN CONVERTING FACTOR, SUBUNIT 2 [Helicobacter pylori J99]|uniref:Molybdopterin synthase catalytic subunit n=1 Tax=Helicobacter pylori (strain J99 / ATCC 700824) TaxID=85963 RepID=MOAE_HELPJ|nr:molybdenum cofactor biosynthesis protein MoaE [Helicobacter pylori]Q9ZL44.1 RecName: Full=Molybdopterin synthase catalytic subunit; AltName: Full=MPT synthase subunit 2; AltName: Full=Molybdenum cofactor biosynthesis protein E; AltName: Full=Molybdopterin-converting factor large subunit; AltName: Full=Molybdopterin-converting factor subunit 2 [Helicobacter pylori J99]AAD06322.1 MOLYBDOPTERIN CONVERTING FACTOR, SUBUNIT 2 [Helicobacter pylori J99]
MLKIVQGALDTDKLLKDYQEEACTKNFGAFCVFVGIVREEGNVQGLSFDIYEALLKTWFEKWRHQPKDLGVVLKMAHSVGDVLIRHSSFLCVLMGANTKNALKLYEYFFKNFKRNAPIWKCYLSDNERIYAKKKDHLLKGSGLLA